MKKLAKKAVAAILGWQIRRLYKKNNFKVIAVAGSIGKTSTKLAIAGVLKTGFKIQYQEGNYNDVVTVPLIFFGEDKPSIFNPVAWLGVFMRNEKRLRRPYPYEIVAIELGSDTPGQIAEFKSYLKLEIGVLTAVTPEHMETFKTLDAVAKEELSMGEMASLILANRDFCVAEYLSDIPNLLTYGSQQSADYQLNIDGNKLSVKSGETVLVEADSRLLSEAEQYSLLAAVATAHKLGMPPAEIKKGLANIKPVPGRMQRLAGLNGSTIIDDSYNASPEAVKLALSSLYKMEAPQKIALLGNMNELGEQSEPAHKEIGGFCDPAELDLVVTLGPDANKFLAPAAQARGCKVKSFDSPYEAGEYIKSQTKSDALILVKGSQNGVFAEEAIKSLLADPSDVQKLVRQTPEWIKQKQADFGR